jgi:hypothetical protein
VQRAAELFGRNIPKELSLVSLGGSSERTFSGPRIDFVALGRRAAPLLNEPKDPPIRLRVATQWYEGNSVQKAP